MTRCIHPQCTSQPGQHPLDCCTTHWYELPTPLRNRIWRYYARSSQLALAKATKEALHHWAGPTAPRKGLRCHQCKTPTILIDHDHNNPICITCVRSTLTGTGPSTLTCSRCHQPAPMLSAGDDGPDLCLDCQYQQALNQEQLTQKGTL